MLPNRNIIQLKHSSNTARTSPIQRKITFYELSMYVGSIHVRQNRHLRCQDHLPSDTATRSAASLPVDKSAVLRWRSAHKRKQDAGSNQIPVKIKSRKVLRNSQCGLMPVDNEPHPNKDSAHPQMQYAHTVQLPQCKSCICRCRRKLGAFGAACMPEQGKQTMLFSTIAGTHRRTQASSSQPV